MRRNNYARPAPDRATYNFTKPCSFSCCRPQGVLCQDTEDLIHKLTRPKEKSLENQQA